MVDDPRNQDDYFAVVVDVGLRAEIPGVGLVDPIGRIIESLPEKLEMCEIAGRVSTLTRELLEEGGDASDVAFALTTVAADMSLQVTGDAMQVIPVLLDAIAFQAKRRLDTSDEGVADGAEICHAEIPAKGTPIH